MGLLEDFWFALALVELLIIVPLVIVIISEHVKRRKRASKNVLEGDRAFIYVNIASSFIIGIRLYELLSKDNGFLIVFSGIIVSFLTFFYFIKMVSKVWAYVDKKLFFASITMTSLYLILEVISKIRGYGDLFKTVTYLEGSIALILFNFIVVKYLIDTKAVNV